MFVFNLQVVIFTVSQLSIKSSSYQEYGFFQRTFICRRVARVAWLEAFALPSQPKLFKWLGFALVPIKVPLPVNLILAIGTKVSFRHYIKIEAILLLKKIFLQVRFS